MVWIITIAAILGIVGGAGYVATVVSRRQEKQQRYMSVISRNKTSLSTTEENRDRQLAKQRADIARKLKEASAGNAEKKKDKMTVRQRMIEAGIEKPASYFWIGSLICAAVVWLILTGLTKWPQAAIIMTTFAAGFGLPRWILKKLAQRRQTAFLKEFPDALDASVRLLQAGMPITEAVAMVSREFEGPLRDEMQRMYENQKIGVSLGGAALEMAHRIPLPEVHMFATALQIQSETGSSLSEVLGNLSAVIRARFRLKRKIKALSSEAKASAAIIGSLPPLVTLGLYFANRKYIMILFETHSGNVTLGCALFWMFCGIMVMKQMINFKI